MNTLRIFLNALPVPDQEVFARECGTSVGYLRKAMSTGARLGVELCVSIEKASHRKVVCEDLRPDVDWAYLRAADRRSGTDRRSGGDRRKSDRRADAA